MALINRGRDRRAFRPSRGMISGEMSWAAVAIVLAWSGSGFAPMAGTYLNLVLARKGWLDPYLWAAAIGIPAAALLVVAGWEYAFSKRHAWTLERVELWSKLRGWLDVALAFSWLYMVHVLETMSARPSALRGIGYLGIAFAAWFIVENRRVRRECRKRRDRDRSLVSARL